ncbi:MAG TPA: thioredoxin family protein [Cytophagales bacterium]|nr:thioredoxin family protein [Cytophagales bacterium]
MEKIIESTQNPATNHNRIVSKEEWILERKEFLKKEKELTRLGDKLSQERRKLPWVKVEKPYVFEGPDGKNTLSDLFQGRSQLIVQHFMFAPGWKEGCVGCSFGADHVDAARMHFENKDVSFVAVSRAPIAEIESFKTRMGWRFKWVSSYGSDFNYDYHVSFTEEEIKKGKGYFNFDLVDVHEEEAPGVSVFIKDETGNVFHTYSTYGRGDEKTISAYMFLDLTPKGRNETGPNGNLTDWVRHHDKYNHSGYVDSTGRYQSLEEDSCCGSKKEAI